MKIVWITIPFIFFSWGSGAAESSENEQACSDKMFLQIEIAVLNSNLANLNTTRTANGGPYLYKKLACVGGTCRVTSTASMRWVYDPEHPDANDLGYVAYPSFDVNQEREWLHGKTQDLENAERLCP